MNLPFYFIFYGVKYERVWVCSNGFLSFDSESTNPIPQPIPNTGKPNSLVAPFWRDLNPSMGGSITYGTIYAELIPSQQIQLEFTLPNNSKEARTYILYTEGHYYTIP